VMAAAGDGRGELDADVEETWPIGPRTAWHRS